MKLFFVTSIFLCLVSCANHTTEKAYSDTKKLSPIEIDKLSKEAIKGNKLSTIKLVSFYSSNDQEEYLFWLKLASLQGEPIAMTWLAYFYEHRLKKLDQAKEWYKRSSPYFPIEANYHVADILVKQGNQYELAREYYCKSYLAGRGDYIFVEQSLADLEKQQNNHKHALAWELINKHRLGPSEDREIIIKTLSSLLTKNEIEEAEAIAKENRICIKVKTHDDLNQ